MQDMLVRLLNLPDVSGLENQLNNAGIIIRRPIAPEKSIVAHWVGKHYSEFWKNEVEVAFTRLPVTCFVAQRGQDILGFSCYECSYKNFFGPTGVLEAENGKGIGRVLLIKSLLGLKEMGYAYAIIGGVGPAEYYQKTVNAVAIEGSEISIYQHLLRKKQ